MTPLRPHPQKAQGFAAATALFAIGLFVLLGAVMAASARSNAKAKMFHETKEAMVAQSDLILNMLLLCRTLYPAGDNGNGNPDRRMYPATPGGGASGPLDTLSCPGQGGTVIWSGDSRAMAPRALPGYAPWSYTNDGTSIRISITATNAGVPYYQDLLDRVAAKVGTSQAVRNADTLTITLIN